MHTHLKIVAGALVVALLVLVFAEASFFSNLKERFMGISGLGAQVAGATLSDLIPGTLTVPSATVDVPVTLKATVKNVGNASASNFPNVFQVGDKNDSNLENVLAQNLSLEPGASGNISTSYTFRTAGTISVRVCVDLPPLWIGTTLELDDSNNCSGWKTITVSDAESEEETSSTPTSSSASLPDLTASTPSAITATPNTSVTFSSTVKNTGKAYAGNFPNVFQVQDSNEVIENIDASRVSLGAGASERITKSYVFKTAGTYSIRACADLPPLWTGTLLESDDSNNCSAWRPVTVSSAPVEEPEVARNNVVFVFAGESNSGGAAHNSDATSAELAPRSSVQIMNLTSGKFEFENLDIGTNNLQDHAGFENYYTMYHGLELQLANSVEGNAFPDLSQVYLVKTGQGGSILSNWTKSGTYWKKFTERTDAAKKNVSNPKWVVWMSIGLNDYYVAKSSASSYKANLLVFINQIKAELPGATIVLTGFESVNVPTYTAVMKEIAQEEDNVYVVDTSNAELGDSVHWNYKGLKTVGARMVTLTAEALGLTSAKTTSSGTNAPASTNATYSSIYYRDLYLGSEGEDVRALQQFLNARGYTVSASGPGSLGYETTAFELRTKEALQKFQMVRGINPSSGYFGPVTRAAVIELSSN